MIISAVTATSNARQEADVQVLAIHLQGVFLQEVQKDTMLLKDYLDPKLKYGIIRFRENVCVIG